MKQIRIVALALLVAAAAAADDGQMLRRNVSKTPDLETDHATLKTMQLYVPARASNGDLLTDEGIPYYNVEGTLVETRFAARPLIAFYHDGEVEHVPHVGFPGHGERDVFGAVSLDDGQTWRRTNLSKSGDLSSFTIRDGRRQVPYPGDTFRLFATAAGDKVVVAWASRYCQGGNPNFTMDDAERAAMASHLGILNTEDCTDGDPASECMYLEDYWGVAGSQGSVDYGESDIVEYQAIGEVPYACLWAARGTLEPVDPETGLVVETSEHYEIVWRQAERLTSGRRDVHRIETAAAAGAGVVITWQEDPEGLRPGKGEGPGEGWSGAIAHHQTDIWYSYVGWDDFDLVDGSTVDGYGDPIPILDYQEEGIPGVGVPFSMPVRLTDNAMCLAGGLDDAYCYADFDGSGTADFCAGSVMVTIETPEGPTQDVELCITEDGRLLRGNIASTRARTNLRGYDTDGDGVADRAWVVMAYEESKGLGEEEDLDPLDLIEKIDMGKNIWFHTFDMFQPELVSQGLMLNQPAVYPEGYPATGDGRLTPVTVTVDGIEYTFMDIDPDPIYEDQAGLVSTLYQAEIARRFSMITQGAGRAGPSGTVGLMMWKQGIIRQGGPADVMARRFTLPSDFDPAVDNPFDYANMECAAWQFTDGANPRYVKGLCVAPALALSTTTIVAGDGTICTDEASCVAAFPWNEYFDDIAGGTQLAKIHEWRQCNGLTTIEGCTLDSDFDDQSWENPYDVAKGHRGYMDGDFIMMLYAWSPNWMANTVGHDNYNLYVRRSFDGGQTWTTTPAAFLHTDGVTYGGGGTTTCEWMGAAGGDTEYPICIAYGAGDFEQARNVSQLIGTQVTVLDPRYSRTPGDITTATVPDGFGQWVVPYDDDTRDPSRFFMVYETGDNTTVAEGEAEPLDLFYSRAVDWGDNYLVWQDVADASACLPSADTGDDYELAGFCNEFDWLEGSHLSLSGEAAVTANPGGTLFYAVWNQEDLDKHERLKGSDAWFRRVMFLDDYVPPEDEPTDPPGPGKGKK